MCSRLNATLEQGDLSLTKRIISLAMECFGNAELMGGCAEMEVKLLVLQLLDRLVDRPIVRSSD